LEKKPWQKPQLVSLVRRDPQEAVLDVCKASLGAASGDPSTSYTGCSQPWPDGPTDCIYCFGNIDS
jgi:hypothetical protein